MTHCEKWAKYFIIQIGKKEILKAIWFDYDGYNHSISFNPFIFGCKSLSFGRDIEAQFIIIYIPANFVFKQQGIKAIENTWILSLFWSKSLGNFSAYQQKSDFAFCKIGFQWLIFSFFYFYPELYNCLEKTASKMLMLDFFEFISSLFYLLDQKGISRSYHMFWVFIKESL